MDCEPTDEVWGRIPRPYKQTCGWLLFLLAGWSISSHTHDPHNARLVCKLFWACYFKQRWQKTANFICSEKIVCSLPISNSIFTTNYGLRTASLTKALSKWLIDLSLKARYLSQTLFSIANSVQLYIRLLLKVILRYQVLWIHL